MSFIIIMLSVCLIGTIAVVKLANKFPITIGDDEY